MAMKRPAGEDENAGMKRKAYEKELRKLQVELCHLQAWVKAKGARIIIVFEGRDAAGKGGTIKAITERVSPRVFRVVALPAPSDRERTQLFMQRYIERFPAAGEIVIFDRSWYNRAGVEYVMGFCSDEQHRRFLELCPQVEKYAVDGGIILIKIWLEVGKEEQERRFHARIDDPVQSRGLAVCGDAEKPQLALRAQPLEGRHDLVEHALGGKIGPLCRADDRVVKLEQIDAIALQSL